MKLVTPATVPSLLLLYLLPKWKLQQLNIFLASHNSAWKNGSSRYPEWWGAGVVICLEQGADLHMAQLVPLPLTVSCFSKIQFFLPFWYWPTRVVPDKGPLNGCVCVVQSCQCYVHLWKVCGPYKHQQTYAEIWYRIALFDITFKGENCRVTRYYMRCYFNCTQKLTCHLDSKTKHRKKEKTKK